MRDWITAVAVTLCAGGCSFIYNPDNIAKGDGGTHAVDVEIVADVNPAAIALTSVYPALVYEGVGQGNSRPALIVVRGTNIAPNATVTVVPVTGAPSQVTVVGTKVALDHNFIAISLAVPVDPLQDETGAKAVARLGLTISVDNGGGVVKAIDGASDGGLKLVFLDQLTAPITAPPDPGKRYSAINVAAANPFAASATASVIHLRSESAIVFGAGVTANASGTVPGPGGCAGGDKATSAPAMNSLMYACSAGAGNGSSGGGGGGHAAAGGSGSVAGLGSVAATGGGVRGSDPILDLTAEAGGGGGGGGITVGSEGTGGGGGGIIYLDAAGDLTASISANGAQGMSGSASGGGGAGGTILLKAGGMLSAPSVTATPGAAQGSGGGAGGAGGTGRIRFDAASGMPTATPAAYQGATFKTVSSYSYVQNVSSSAELQVIGPIGVTGFVGQVYGPNDSAGSSFDLSFGGGGLAQPTVGLTAGYNRICVGVPGSNILVHPESANCAEMAFLPGGAPL